MNYSRRANAPLFPPVKFNWVQTCIEIAARIVHFCVFFTHSRPTRPGVCWKTNYCSEHTKKACFSVACCFNYVDRALGMGFAEYIKKQKKLFKSILIGRVLNYAHYENNNNTFRRKIHIYSLDGARSILKRT